MTVPGIESVTGSAFVGAVMGEAFLLTRGGVAAGLGVTLALTRCKVSIR